ncbi:hypothetical protein N007_00720 [Alicyclobacillus acidoterrestris ATCC 49025]|nr:hypothetical protein N007_00720 [Alicyclobacillus acidoterrestris ATCC 49025]
MSRGGGAGALAGSRIGQPDRAAVVLARIAQIFDLIALPGSKSKHIRPILYPIRTKSAHFAPATRE